MSNVYVFTAIADSHVQLQLNGGDLVGTGSASRAPYAPYSVSYPRVPKAQWSSRPTPDQLEGANTLLVRTQNTAYEYAVAVPESYPDGMDLVLYVYLGVALLLDTDGRPEPLGGGVFYGTSTLGTCAAV